MQNEKILTLLHLAEKEVQVILSRKSGRLKEMVSSEGGLEKLIQLRRDQFWERVNVGLPNECWPWTGCRFTKTDRHLPYGKTKIFGYGTTAHRVSYLLTVGSVPQSMNVCHTCDNPPCCNPQHHFLGDDFANMRDSVEKGRWKSGQLKGRDHGRAKLTDSQVIEIRAMRDYGVPLKEVASTFGIGIANVSAIALRQTWRHI